jgi:hypothetical protein
VRLRLAATSLAIFTAAAIPAAAGVPPLAGRWERVTTCFELVGALRKAGLRSIAPAIVAGNGLVPGTPKQLARKKNICAGAVPRVHSHYFTAAGQFGSLDWKLRQVDDGSYRIVTSGRVRINNGTFRFSIDTKQLSLKPVLTAAEKRQALAHPLAFSKAGWMVAVALAGHEWRRVPCAGWC